MYLCWEQGLVSRPLVHYLLKKDYQVTVATRTVSKAEKLISGFKNGRAIPLVVDNRAKLEQLVKEHDLSVSLLPAPLHRLWRRCAFAIKNTWSQHPTSARRCRKWINRRAMRAWFC